jgi:hypothetical protein
VTGDLLEAWVVAWKPRRRVAPSVWAETYRVLKDGTTARPGKFSFDGFGFMRSILDTVEEAIATGRRWVFMKPAQIGGSETVLNALGWVQTFHAGPTLYMTSTDDVAKEFSVDRLSFMCETCEPLREKFLPARGGRDEIYVKRFVDGKVSICGGKSINNFQSHPYRNVFIDEADTLAELAGAGDPVKLADLRTAAYSLFGSTFVGAFAHPSTKEGPVGHLYYEKSDQRRAFVVCPHCKGDFWLSWEHVKVIAGDGQSPAVAERDAENYHYFAPCCGAELSDAQRLDVAQRAKQKSTLPDDVAKKKPWIGVHISHLYTKSLLELAREWISGLDNPAEKRVVVNKYLGDIHEESTQQTTVEVWEALAPDHGEHGSYERGKVPEGVSWLTAGTDARQLELHWTVWGWGNVETESGHPALCGWLIDYGVEPGPQASDKNRTVLSADDLQVFDQSIYDRAWPNWNGTRQYVVLQGLHDSRWCPVATYEYCRSKPGRAFPSMGLGVDDRSAAPPWRLTGSIRYRVGTEIIEDETLRRADLNTYVLKLDFSGLARAHFRTPLQVPQPRLALPRDVSDEFLRHLASEKLVLDPRTKRRSWRKTTHENHWWDATILAYVAALMTAPPSPNSAKVQSPTVVQNERRTWGGGRPKWLRRRR